MAIRLLSTLFDFAPGTIVRDLSFDIEKRLVARGAASYNLSGGTEATVPTLNPNLSDVERRVLMLEELLLTNRNTSTLEPFAVSDWVLQGLYDYNDLATQTTPISIVGGGGFVNITNDGAGPFTNLDNAIPGIANIWDTTNQEFDFSGLSLGDMVHLRVDFTVTTTANNQEGELRLLAGIGSASEFPLSILQNQIKSIGTYQLAATTFLYIGSNDIKNNPAKLQMQSPDNASVVVNGWAVNVQPRFPIFQL